VENEILSTLRWTYGFNTKDRKKSMELRKLLGLQPISLAIMRGRRWWCGHSDDDANYRKWYM